MVKTEIIQKILKLKKLSQGNSNPHEAESAKTKMLELMKEHDISDGEIKVEEKAAAFDELVQEIKSFSLKNPSIPSIFGGTSVIDGVLDVLKSAKDAEKAVRLDQIRSMIGTASLLLGRNKTFIGIRDIIEKIIKKHAL